MKHLTEGQRLGIGQPIARRDFLNGLALAIGGAYGFSGLPLAVAQSGSATNSPTNGTDDFYPPLRNGLRGNYPAAIADFNQLEQGAYKDAAAHSTPIEDYDLVIVGGGISGLSAAYFYREALGLKQKILILDNHDDFGGHAKRNEFHLQGKTYLGFGGTFAILTPYPYSYTAKALISDLGIEVERYPEFVNHDLETKFNLRSAMFFDKEHCGEDRLVLGYGRLPWPEFFAQTPLSEAARQDLVRLHGKNPDYMAGVPEQEKRLQLEKMSYQDFLLNIAKITPEALVFFLGEGARNNKRVDTLPALEAAEHGAIGFNGLGLKLPHEFNEGAYFFHFPDGNASIARLLVSKLIPDALPGKQTMNTVVQAPLDYSRLDNVESKIRLRLSSTVVRVQHDGPSENSEWVNVAYRQNGSIKTVRGRYCILACYNRLIPYLTPELPEEQKRALAYPVKVPMMYTNVLIRKWSAFQKLGVSQISAPGMYYTHVSLDPGTTVGGYSGASSPDEPILVHMIRHPNKPGLPRKEQHLVGQQELLSTSFEQFELEIRKQLDRMLRQGGFDAAKDIAAITVNRWPYGYAYTYDTLADPDVPPEQRPHVIGRRRFGRITIANSDAGAAAFTNQAIDEANRAVQELLVFQHLT
ncbi:MAG TPA: NAD(P)-binding protein [Terriglobales bacterium]|nr:NAD(P)-binding protein [Terriglobales bacterium]